MLQYDNVFCRFGNNHYLCSTYYHQQIQDMKQRTLLIALLLGMVLGASGQIALSRLTAYNDFRPAIAHLVDGKTLNLPLANIFLKNSSLLYMNNNGTAMEADMRNPTSKAAAMSVSILCWLIASTLSVPARSIVLGSST